jgi:hypothetical protein
MFWAEGEVNSLFGDVEGLTVVVDVEVGATVMVDVDEVLVDDEAGVTNPNWLPVTTVTAAPSVTSLGS